jgi:SAM-dependent methyltransferase
MNVRVALQRLNARARLIAASRRYAALRRELRGRNSEPMLTNVISQLATAGQIESATYRDWVERLRLPAIRHRKYWEFAFILQALREQDLLRDGRSGLGFGVGKEPLAAMMASMGCEVLASDAPPDLARAAGWGTNDDHASELGSLNERGICPEAVFSSKVSFRVIDMNQIPGDLRGFDFCWSSCALEHLGSIERGLAFIEGSLRCLRPGGLAVHTTEFNLSSDRDTIERGVTVVFRRSDIERLRERLDVAGHRVDVNYNPGEGALDRFVDLPPYRLDPHVKLMIGAFVTTSFGLIVRKAG